MTDFVAKLANQFVDLARVLSDPGKHLGGTVSGRWGGGGGGYAYVQLISEFQTYIEGGCSCSRHRKLSGLKQPKNQRSLGLNLGLHSNIES